MRQAIIALCVLALATSVRAVPIFQQNFNSSSTVGDYVSATPSDGQFNAIGTSGAGVTVSITGGALTYTRAGANLGSYSRTTNFSPIPDTMIYQFDLTISGNTAAQTTAAVFQVGSGFGTANSAEANADTYARVGINFTANAGEFSFRDVTNATSTAALTGTQSITWVLNNSGGSLNYTPPGGGSSSIANDTADLYAGNTLLLDDVLIQTPAQTMSDLKFAFSLGSGTIAIDNIVINTIPEPATLGLLGLALLTLPRRRRAV